MATLKAFRIALYVILCVLGLTAQAHSACDQLSPNPNPTGSSIINASVDGCNDLSPFDNFGTLTNIGTINNTGVLNNNGVLGGNNGTIYNNGIINNNGKAAFIINNTSILYNNGTVNNNLGAVVTDLRLVNNVGASINNYGGIGYCGGCSAGIDNFGTINSYGAMSGNDLVGYNYKGAVWNNYGSSSLVWNGRVNADGSLGEQGGTVNNSGSMFGQLALHNTGVFNNSGRIAAPVGTFLNAGIFSNSGSVFYNVAIRNSGIINNLSGGVTQSAEIANSGKFMVAAGAKASGTSDGGNNLTYTQSAGVTQIDGVLQGRSITIDGGILQGTGTILSQKLPDGHFDVESVTINGGVLAPGSPTGVLTLDGNLAFNAGTLLISIGGKGAGEFSVLNVTGAASFLTGTLAFSFLDGVRPHSGDYWTFLTAEGGIVGWEGLDVQVFGLDSKYKWFLTPTGDSGLTLHLAAVPEPEVYAMMLVGLGLLSWVGRRRNGIPTNI